MCIDARLFFACGSSAPVRVEHEGGAAAWLVGTLVVPSVQGHRLPHAGVQPWWIQGDSKVGTESVSLEKYIFNHRYREIRNG